MAACTALTTDRVGAGRSNSVTFRSERSAFVASGDCPLCRIIITTGRSDQGGCLSNVLRNSPIPGAVVASSVGQQDSSCPDPEFFNQLIEVFTHDARDASLGQE